MNFDDYGVLFREAFADRIAVPEGTLLHRAAAEVLRWLSPTR